MLAAEVAQQVEEAFCLLSELSRDGWSVAVLPRERGFTQTRAFDTLPLLVCLERGDFKIEAKCEQASDVAPTLAAMARAAA